MPPSPLHAPVLDWYAGHARDLPWRRPGTSPWGVLVSEVMLQQTPVARVLPVYLDWLQRWPTPAALAADPPGEAVRAWGRLGYPRRALRLHEAATGWSPRHGGEVPTSYDDLLALPGVGSYTAAAVASFAFGARHAVLDTNVRRVLARAVSAAPAAGADPDRRPSVGSRRDRAARRRPRSPPLGGRRDGARRAGLHRARAALRRLPARGDGAPGAAPAARRTTGRAPRPGASPAPTGRSAGG